VLLALAAVFILRSDSRGDGPAKEAGNSVGASARRPAGGTPKSPASSTDEPTKQTAVARALAQPADFKFIDTPLREIVAFIADRYKINVLLDTKALTDAGVTTETTYTIVLKRASLRSFLRIMLAQKDLAYYEKYGSELVITTDGAAKTRTTLQLYDIAKFASPVNAFSAGATPWDRVAQIIQSTVAPASWVENGGNGSLKIADGKIIVSQTDENQSQIADLLAQLGIARDLATLPENHQTPVTVLPVDAEERKVEEALDSRQDFDFVDNPLKDVADALQTKLGIPIHLDPVAIANAGASENTEISLQLKQVRARDAMHDFLAAHGLSFIVDHELLEITTGDVAKTKTVTRIYPVGDLVSGANSELPDEAVFMALIEKITGCVAPDSWAANGGAASIEAFPVCKALIITQTQDLHHDIRELLSLLRAARKGNPLPVPSPANTRVVRIYRVARASSAAAEDERAAEQLVDMIRKLIEPKSWSDPDVYIGAVRDEVVVRQTLAVHHRIQNLLDALDSAPNLKRSLAPVQPNNSPTLTNGLSGAAAK
jgi:hypothetical protein